MPAQLLLVFEIIGTISFAISGAMTGIKKRMDVLGVVTLGLVTAVGGGAIRDVILGATPPAMFQNPIYAVVAIVTGIVVCFPVVRNVYSKSQRIFDRALLVMDSLGLGIFTVVGIETAHVELQDPAFALLIFVGVITGVGGGILRDVLSGDMPYIFVRHFYACASIIGAVICAVLWTVSIPIAMISGAAVIVVLRFLAAHYRWSLPVPGSDRGEHK